MLLSFVLVSCCLALIHGFAPSAQRISNTRVYENFDLKRTKIESDPLIFTEKQLREFTSTYSVDERMNPFEAIMSIFGGGQPLDTGVGLIPGDIAGQMRNTVSIQLLESRTEDFLKGKASAKQYYTVLQACFAKKLNKVLPDLLEQFPPAKAAELSKLAK
jgi:hypothetical protein